MADEERGLTPRGGVPESQRSEGQGLMPDLAPDSGGGLGTRAPVSRNQAGPADMLDDEEIDVLEILRILRRRWIWAFAAFIVVAVGTGFFVETRVPIFESSTTIRFEGSSRALSVLPELGPNQGSQLNTDIAVIRSRSVAREVAEALRFDVQVVEPGNAMRSVLLEGLSVEPGAVQGRYSFAPQVDGSIRVTSPNEQTFVVQVGQWSQVDGFGFRVLPAAMERPFVVSVSSLEVAASRIQGGLEVNQPVRDASILNIAYRSPNPEMARLVAGAVAQRFIERQGEWRQAGGRTTIAFITDQLALLDTQLADAEGRLLEWRRQNQVIQPQAAAGAEVSRRAQYEAELDRLREEIGTLEGLRAGTIPMTPEVRALPGYRRVLSSPIFASNQAGSTILSTILQLEAERIQLLGSRSAQNPDVLILERTLADYERQGEQFVENYIGTRQAQATSLERLLRSIGTSLLEVPGRELEQKTLERDVEILSELQMLLSQRLKESEISSAAEIPAIEILDEARQPDFPVAPNRSRLLQLGLLLALVSGVGVAIVRDFLDQTLHSARELEQASGAPLLGLIPSFSTRPSRSRYRVRLGKSAKSKSLVPAGDPKQSILTLAEPRHVSAEAYRVLRANLRAGALAGSARVVVLASPSPGDGKSTTAVNLATSLALQGERVLLVDADLRRGVLHRAVGVSGEAGLSQVLAAASGEVESLLDEYTHELELTPEAKLYLLPCGKSPENPTELLGGPRWSSECLALARAHFDAVIIDTPPVNMFADALVASVAADGVILVARAGKSMSDEIEVASGQLRSVGVRLLGGVLNDFNVKRDGRYGNYAYYQRYYGRYYAHYATT